MAKGKLARAVIGTATVLATTPPKAQIINANRDYDPNNPHTWLPLVGDQSGAGGLRVLWGVLHRQYRGHANSAAAFVAAKLHPSWSSDPEMVTAAWAETLAPADADDSFADPMLLAARIDREIAQDPEGKTPLLGYATITDPQTRRLHVFREELRGVARVLVDTYGAPVTAVVHAPGRAGNGNPVHGHLVLCATVVDGTLGFSTRVAPYCGGKGRQIVLDAWRNRQRFD